MAMNVKDKESLNEASKNLSKLKHLKLHLLSKFDRTLHPVGSGSGNIEAKIGFTFRQVTIILKVTPNYNYYVQFNFGNFFYLQ